MSIHGWKLELPPVPMGCATTTPTKNKASQQTYLPFLEPGVPLFGSFNAPCFVPGLFCIQNGKIPPMNGKSARRGRAWLMLVPLGGSSGSPTGIYDAQKASNQT